VAGSELALPQNIRERFLMHEREYCSALELQLQKLKSARPSPNFTSREPKSPEIDLMLMSKPPTETDLLAYFHVDLMPQIESYRRIPVLLRRLDSAFSNIVVR
jgi:hypothetical protein